MLNFEMPKMDRSSVKSTRCTSQTPLLTESGLNYGGIKTFYWDESANRGVAGLILQKTLPTMYLRPQSDGKKAVFDLHVCKMCICTINRKEIYLKKSSIFL